MALITSDPVYNSYGNSVTVDPADNVTLAFKRGSPSVTYALRFDAILQTWSTPEPLVNFYINTTLGSDALGNVYAVGSDSALHVWTTRFDVATKTWGTPTQMDDSLQGLVPTLAVAPNGDVLVVWLQSDTADGSAYAAARWFYSASGTWGPVTHLETAAAEHTLDQVIIDGLGNAMVVGVQGQSLRWIWFDAASSQWKKSLLPTEAAAFVRSVAMGADGGAAMLYINGTGQLFIREFDAIAQTWTARTLLTDNTIGLPSVTTDGQGNWVAAWIDGAGVWAIRRAPADLGWSSVVPIGGVPSSLGAQIATVIDHQGNAHAVWSDGNISASWYDVASDAWRPSVPLENLPGDGGVLGLRVRSNNDVLSFLNQQDAAGIYALYQSDFRCE